MTPESLDALLSRACAYGSRLDYVLERMHGVIPAIVAWGDNGRKTMCGPWCPLTECSEVWAVFAAWRVFDYMISEMPVSECKATLYAPYLVTIDIKEYERRASNGESQTFA